MTHNIAQLIETGQDERISALEAEVATLRRQADDALRNILAVVHRDGGHHTQSVGLEQSCADAEAICHEWKVMPERIAALEAEVAELRCDRERVKWLEGKGTIEITCWASYTDTYSVGEQADDGESYNSLREALDAAMTAEEEPCPQLSE